MLVVPKTTGSGGICLWTLGLSAVMLLQAATGLAAQTRTGSLHVEVLDAAGKVLAASSTISGDGPRGKVSWESNSLAKLSEKVVSLRFTLRNGSLYSYWFEGGRR